MSRHTPDHYMADVARMLGIEDAAVHDLRRTLATNLAAMGVPDNVIERTEGRDKRKGVAGVYNRYQYAPEKLRAQRLWSLRLQEIVRGRKPRGLRW